MNFPGKFDHAAMGANSPVPVVKRQLQVRAGIFFASAAVPFTLASSLIFAAQFNQPFTGQPALVLVCPFDQQI
jgi:hypothetical protein